MKKILFVDDEPRILQGLERMLRSKRKEWEMVFADSPESALEKLNDGRFDMIVSDMRMPIMDGAKLLANVRQRHPEVIRLVLSGHAEIDAALRAVPVAHQFISKPCKAEKLKETIERALNLKDTIEDPKLQALIGEVGQLPARPETYERLTKKMSDLNASLEDIAKIIEKDIGMSAKILQLVNSGFFGVPRKITSLKTAVSQLGMKMVKSIALSFETFQTVGKNSGLNEKTLIAMEQRSFLSAQIASQFMEEKIDKEDAFISAMLQDVGEFMLAAYNPALVEETYKVAIDEKKPRWKIELEQWGVTHGEIGAYLLGIWGLPYRVVEAVAFHHNPEKIGHNRFEIAEAVCLSSIFAFELIPDLNGMPAPKINEEYFSSVGVLDKIEPWREMAKEIFLGKNAGEED